MKSRVLKAGLHAGLAALLIASAGRVPAQTSGPTGFPLEALVPTAEAREFFDSLERFATSGEALPDLPDDLMAPLDPFIAPMFERGERDRNWSSSGVDMHALAEALPGGAAAHMLVGEGPFGPMAALFVDEPPESLAGSEWTPIASFGDLAPSDDVRAGFGRMSPKLLVVERIAVRREGNGLCYERVESHLYSNREVSASEADIISFVMFLRVRQMLDQRRLCMVWIEIEPGRYASRWFDLRGHRFPGLEMDGTLYSLVPRVPTEVAVSVE